MALLDCPECKEKCSSLATSCPHCGHPLRNTAAPAGAPAPVRVLQSGVPRGGAGLRPRRPRPTPIGLKLASPDEFVGFWGMLCAAFLITGFLIPVSVPGRGSGILWPWSLPPGSSPVVLIGMVMPLILGIGSVATIRILKGVQRGVTLFVTAAATLMVYVLLAGGRSAGQIFSLREGAAALAIMVQMPFSAALLATGNHLRKAHPDHGLPAVMAGAGGVFLVLAFLIPVFDRKPMLVAFFEPMVWRAGGFIMLMVLFLLAYGVVGAFSFLRGDPGGLPRWLSIHARILLYGLPASFVITGGFQSGGYFGIFLLMMLKVVLLFYGHTLLVAVGLATWVDEALRRKDMIK